MFKYFFSAFTILFLLSSCNSSESVDVIVKNAKIYTVDDGFQVVNAFAIKDGNFVAVGTSEQIEMDFKSERVIDANHKYIYPGFIDPHCHFVGYGVGLSSKANLVGTTSFDDVLDRLRVFNNENLDNEWLIGRGWDQNDWKNKSFPSNDALNEAFPGKKVYLTRIDGHAALVSDAALKFANLTENLNISGGSILMDGSKPTGVLIDNAMDLVRKLIPNVSRDAKVKGILEAQENCFEVGLTSIHDAGLDKQEILILDSLQKVGSLKMNTYVMLSPTEENFKYFLEKGKYETEKMNIRSIKIYVDGALGSRGAKLLEPYEDDHGNTGLLLTPKSDIIKFAKKAHLAGYQVCTHAIGDGGNQMVLDIFSSFLKGENDKRWRIEHAQVISPDDFSKFKKFSIIPSVQPTHATSDMYWAEDRLGERVKGAYAYQDLLDQNEWIPLGSDFPVEDINPLFGFYAATERKDQKNYPEGGFQSKNGLSREDALKGMTIWAAKAGFEEHKYGSIEVGKKANFVILQNDIMDETIKETYKVKVLTTFINGKEVFNSK